MQKIIFKFRDNLFLSKKFCESSKFLFHLVADGGSGATKYYKNYKRFRSLRNISNYYILSKNAIKKSNATLPRIDGMGLLDFFATLSDSSKFNYQIEYLFYKNDSDIFIRLYNEYTNRLSTETSTNISKTGNDNYYFVNFFNYFSVTIIDEEKRLKPSKIKKEYDRILNRLGEFLTKNVDTTFSSSEQEFILESAYLTTDTISAAPQKRMKKNEGYENFLESTKFKIFETNEDKDQIISILEDSSWNFYESYFKTIDIKLVYPKQLFPPSKTTVIDYLKSKIRLGELSHGDKTLKTLIDELGCKSHKYRLFSINAWEFDKFKYKESAFLETLCNKQNSTLNQVSPRGSIILFEFQTLTDGVGLPVQTEPLMFELMCLANFFEQIIIEPLGNNPKNEKDVSEYIGTNRKTFDYKTPLKSWKAYFLEKTITINKDFAEAYLKRKHDIDLYYINNIEAFYNSFQPYIINNRNIIYSNDKIEPSILVGAATLIGNKYEHYSGTNYRSDSKTVHGYGAGTEHEFTHTSAAAAIIAGFIMKIQEFAIQNNIYIRPSLMKKLLMIQRFSEMNLVYHSSGKLLGAIPNLELIIDVLKVQISKRYPNNYLLDLSKINLDNVLINETIVQVDKSDYI